MESANLTGVALGSGKIKALEIKGVKMQNRRIRDVEKAGGVEGMLVGLGSKNGLVVSIDVIERALIIQLQGYCVQAI